jgi:hypothetical protein
MLTIELKREEINERINTALMFELNINVKQREI